jgi:hypothetical protein
MDSYTNELDSNYKLNSFIKITGIINNPYNVLAVATLLQNVGLLKLKPNQG